MKTAYEILKEAEKMSKEVIAAEADGKVIGLSEVVADGAEVKPLTFADKEGKKVFWHTASHILAQAVKRLYPEAKLTIGPSTTASIMTSTPKPPSLPKFLRRSKRR